MVPTPLKQQRFYGWLALAGAMLAICSTLGNVVIAYGIFLPAMSDDLGWSRSYLSATRSAPSSAVSILFAFIVLPLKLGI